MRTICVSTGTVYKISEDMNEKIRLIGQFGQDGIELNFAFARDLLAFEATTASLSHLKNRRVTIHAPWKDITYGENPHCRQTLDAMQKLYNQINASLVNVHFVEGQDLGVFSNYQMKVTIENEDWRKETSQTPEQIEALLKQYPKFGFTFDFAHAYSISPELAADFLKKLKEKMTQVHLAYLDKTLPDHWFLHKKMTRELESLVRQIPSRTPLVLECVASDKSEFPLIGNELIFLRTFT